MNILTKALTQASNSSYQDVAVMVNKRTFTSMKGFVHATTNLVGITKAPFYFDETYGFGPFFAGSKMVVIAIDENLPNNDYIFVPVSFEKEEKHKAVQHAITAYEKHLDAKTKAKKHKEQIKQAKKHKEKNSTTSSQKKDVSKS